MTFLVFVYLLEYHTFLAHPVTCWLPIDILIFLAGCVKNIYVQPDEAPIEHLN